MKAKRVIYIKIPEEEKGDPGKFIEKLSKALRTQEAVLKLEDDRIRIEVYGSKARIRDTITNIKKLLSEYRIAGGEYSFTPTLIFKRVGTAIPLDVLAFLLKLEGWSAEYKNRVLSTNASLSDVIAIGILLREAMSKISHLNVSGAVKKAVAAASIEVGRSPEYLLSLAIDKNLIVEYGGKLVPKTSWIELAKTLINLGRGPLEGGSS